MSSHLAVAAAMGRRLVDEAIWHAGSCNWIGALPEGGPTSATSGVYAAMGPDLYAGTAGIALVLAELHAVTGDQALCRTALGAIRHALERADRLPREAILGLYAGPLGVALAAARVSAALQDPEPAEKAAALLARHEREDPASQEFDLVAGQAGGILALLALAGLVGEARLVEWAQRLGATLVAAARVSEQGCSWPAPGIASDGDLTGLSHGASGPGLALLELHRATGEEIFRDTALAAFAYERTLFDAEAGNWRDLRELTAPAGTPRYMTAWCHGAPGIALTRLRAVELLGDEACGLDAVAALETTRNAVRDALESSPPDWSLCHGLTGLAEVLTSGPEVLGDGWADDRALALGVAEAGIDRYARSGRAWPCGTLDAETPGLMQGLAGIALFYLRMADPGVPSALLVLPAAWRSDVARSSGTTRP